MTEFDPYDRRTSGFPDRRMLEEVLIEISSSIDDLEYGVLDRSEPDPKKRRRGLSAYDLLARTRTRSGDGFPSGKGIGGGRSGSGSSIVEATVVQALDHGERDDMVKAFWAMWNDMIGLRDALRGAVQTLVDATPPVAGPGDPVCRSCGNILVYALERCRWCYDWFRAEGADPPPDIVKARRDGKRITTKLAAEAKAALAAQARQRKKKGRR